MSLTTGAGLQKFRAWVRKSAGTPNPTLDMYVYESGSSKAQLLTATSITSTTGQLVEATWDASLVSDLTGAGVECRIVGNVATGPGALPAYSAAGTLFSGTATGAQSINIPSHASGDLLVLVALASCTNSNGTVTSLGSGWTQLGGAGTTYGSGVTKFGVGWWPGNGSNTTVSVTFGGTGTVRFLARVFKVTAANGFATTAVANVSTETNGSGTSVTMPSVTPSGTNQRAIAIIAHSVSSTVAPSTGESGGDWTEAVAESTATNGTIDLQTSSQAGGGAISGGTAVMGTTGTWASVGFTAVPAPSVNVNTVEIGAVEWVVAITASIDVTLTPTAGAVTVTGLAPTVSAGLGVTSSLGAVAVAGSAPTFAATVPAVPTPGAVSVGGLVPTISVGSNLTPSLGTVTAAGKIPTVAAGATLIPNAGAAAIGGFAPTFSATVPATPTAGTVAVSGNVPIVSTGASLAAGLGAIVASGFAPSFSLGATLTSAVGAITVVGQTPAVLVGGSFSAVAGAGAIVASGLAPTISTSASLTTVLGSAAVTGTAPIFSAPVGATPSVGAATVLGHAPIFSAVVAATPTAGTITVLGRAPTVAAGATLAPASAAVILAGQPPLVAAAGNVMALPGAGVTAVVGRVPIFSISINLQVGTGAAQAAGLAPTPSVNSGVAALNGTITAQGYAPFWEPGVSHVLTPAAGVISIHSHVAEFKVIKITSAPIDAGFGSGIIDLGEVTSEIYDRDKAA